ncbi:MAG: metal-dependent hydrolase [Bacteroidota bacterium]
MDSITQITLGAAVGELVLGKKIGNRAMLWGGVAGTIPDLDILLNLVLDPINALAQHRGLSHSFFFAIISCWIFGYFVHRLYDSGTYKKQWYKVIVMFGAFISILFVSAFINAIFWAARGSFYIPTILICLITMIFLMIRFYKNYYKGSSLTVDTNYRDWVKLFFWCIITHPVLDSFTVYGTQLFQPFSDFRVGFNNIAVVDPLYTAWYLLLIPALFMDKLNIRRRHLTIAALVLSSIYIAFTIWNKSRINKVFETILQERGIQVDRYMTSPTIMNNLLWHCIGESDKVYYQGLYSVNDSKPQLHKILAIPKNHEYLAAYKNGEVMQTLEWFSNGYYNIEKLNSDSFQLNDLRYGMFSDSIRSEDDYIFSFYLQPDGDELIFSNKNKGPENSDRMLGDFWKRMMGEVEFVDTVIIVKNQFEGL